MRFSDILLNSDLILPLLVLPVVLLAVVGLLLWSIHLSTKMPGVGSSALPDGPLGENEKAIARSIRKDVRMLAETIGPRSIFRYENLSAAAQYLKEEFEALGYSIRLQEFSPGGYAKAVVNIEAERLGSLHPEEIVIVGAHYDSPGDHCPGADNASGCAALLWLAAQCKAVTPSRTIRFVAFVNEEPPFFKTSNMGSYQYAKAARERDEQIIAFICLESLGFFSNYPKTQQYPFPLSWWYADRGDFLAFVGNWKSAVVVRRSVLTFRTLSAVPSVGFAAPSWFPGVSWSDHWSFWKFGYSAFMITDTAHYRNQYYHTDNDRWDTLDYASLARALPGIEAVVRDLLRVRE